MNYKTLNALPALAFLNPETFVTSFDDVKKGYKQEQYEHGLQVSREAKRVTISINSAWSAQMQGGSFLSSYEGIGYHSCTADLLRGFLDGGAEIVVFRDTGAGISETIIKEGK